jgi:hypothetical protein
VNKERCAGGRSRVRAGVPDLRHVSQAFRHRFVGKTARAAAGRRAPYVVEKDLRRRVSPVIFAPLSPVSGLIDRIGCVQNRQSKGQSFSAPGAALLLFRLMASKHREDKIVHAVACPRCGAPRGQQCRTANGARRGANNAIPNGVRANDVLSGVTTILATNNALETR